MLVGAIPGKVVVVAAAVSASLEALCYDPQTSGGLLAAVDGRDVAALARAGFVAVGEVVEGVAAVELS